MLNELDLGHATEELPIVCTLTEEEKVERSEENGGVFQAAEQVRELPDGYAFRFPGSAATASRLLEFVLAERSCCQFFTFELGFEPNEGPVWLSLRGSEAVKEFVVSNLGEVIAAHA